MAGATLDAVLTTLEQDVDGARTLGGHSTSMADGTACPCRTAWTTDCACAGSVTGALSHRVAAGSGCSRKTASVITASVPREPMTSLPRS